MSQFRQPDRTRAPVTGSSPSSIMQLMRMPFPPLPCTVFSDTVVPARGKLSVPESKKMPLPLPVPVIPLPFPMTWFLDTVFWPERRKRPLPKLFLMRLFRMTVRSARRLTLTPSLLLESMMLLSMVLSALPNETATPPAKLFVELFPVTRLLVTRLLVALDKKRIPTPPLLSTMLPVIVLLVARSSILIPPLPFKSNTLFGPMVLNWELTMARPSLKSLISSSVPLPLGWLPRLSVKRIPETELLVDGCVAPPWITMPASKSWMVAPGRVEMTLTRLLPTRRRPTPSPKPPVIFPSESVSSGMPLIVCPLRSSVTLLALKMRPSDLHGPMSFWRTNTGCCAFGSVTAFPQLPVNDLKFALLGAAELLPANPRLATRVIDPKTASLLVVHLPIMNTPSPLVVGMIDATLSVISEVSSTAPGPTRHRARRLRLVRLKDLSTRREAPGVWYGRL